MAASAADTPAGNPNRIKRLLDNGASALFINGKPAVINGLKKLTNPPSWLVNLVLVPFNKSPLFSKDFIIFVMTFTNCLLELFLDLYLT